MTILGTPGDDNLTGTSGDDIFDLRQGGNDTAQGLGGNDIFTFGATFTAADSVDGGAGVDQIRLNGDYSAGVVFSATTMTSVMSIAVSGGFTYNLTTNDANLAAGSHLTVNGSNLTAGGALLFNGTDETDGRFVLTGGGQGDDILRGGAGADTFNIGVNAPGNGGEDRVEGREGNDIVNVGAALDAGDKIDGGGGNDTLVFDGDYTGSHALTLAPTTVENITTFVFAAGHSYDITTDDHTITPQKPTHIDASQLGAADSLTFDGSAETDAALVITGGAGNDDIHGSNIGNTFDLSKGGNDIVTGGAGTDHFIMGAALNAGDVLDGGFNGLADKVVIDGDYTHANALTLNAGTLQNINQLELMDGFNYHITVAGNLPGLQVLLDPTSGTVFFDGSGDRSSFSQFIFSGLPGTTTANYILTGGYNNDIFNLQNATQYTLRGGHGGDDFRIGAGFTASDFIDGGGGEDTVEFSGQTVALDAANIFNVEHYMLDNVASGFTYHFTVTDADIPPGGALFIDANDAVSDSLIVDASAVTSGSVSMAGGGGPDTLIGGAGRDGLGMGGGNGNTVTGGGGGDNIGWGAGSNNVAIYNAVSDSTGVNYDQMGGNSLNFNIDHIQIHTLGALPTAIDPVVSGGTLSTATFDADLAAAVGAGQLAAGHAVEFKVNAGSLKGHTFLVVDENGVAGYQAGQDLVFDVSHASGTLTTGFFI